MTTLDATKPAEEIAEDIVSELEHMSDHAQRKIMHSAQERLEDIRAYKIWQHALEHPDELVNSDISREKIKQRYGI